MREELYQLAREDVPTQEWQAAVVAFTSACDVARKLADARAAAVEPAWLGLPSGEHLSPVRHSIMVTASAGLLGSRCFGCAAEAVQFHRDVAQ